jgi:WD40 repeat protein
MWIWILQSSLALAAPSNASRMVQPCDDSLHYGEGSSSLTCVAVFSLPLVQLRENGHTQIAASSSASDSLTMMYTNHQPAWCCCFTRDGRHIAVAYGAPDPCIRIFRNVNDEGHCNSSHAQTDSNGGQWSLVDTLVGMQLRTIRCVAFAPIHRPLVLAAASFDGTIAIWEQQQSTTFAMNAFSSDTNTTTTTAATGSAPAMNTTTHLNHSWECTAQLEGHENEVKCVEWNATGSLLATCGRDKVRVSKFIRVRKQIVWTKLALDTLTQFALYRSL